MASESKTSVDHDEIRQWVEKNEGSPACVRSTGDADDPGILRFDFPGGAGEDALQHISWEDWFDKFDAERLALLYQEHKADGEASTFFKIVKR